MAYVTHQNLISNPWKIHYPLSPPPPPKKHKRQQITTMDDRKTESSENLDKMGSPKQSRNNK